MRWGARQGTVAADGCWPARRIGVDGVYVFFAGPDFSADEVAIAEGAYLFSQISTHDELSLWCALIMTGIDHEHAQQSARPRS